MFGDNNIAKNFAKYQTYDIFLFSFKIFGVNEHHYVHGALTSKLRGARFEQRSDDASVFAIVDMAHNISYSSGLFHISNMFQIFSEVLSDNYTYILDVYSLVDENGNFASINAAKMDLDNGSSRLTLENGTTYVCIYHCVY